MNDSAPSVSRPSPIPPEAEQAFAQGAKLQQAGAHAQAIAFYKAAVAAYHDFADAWNNLGIAYRAIGNYRHAIGAYREALRVDPRRPAILSNLGNALKDAGHADQAVVYHRRALELEPSNAALLHNCGIAEKAAGRSAEALALFERSIALEPERQDAQWDRAVTLLQRGDFARGWPAYEWRWKLKEVRLPQYARPLWRGEPLAGKSILLFGEQGFGDAIQFIRYASLVRAHGATRVIAEVRSELVRLFKTAAGVDDVVEIGSAPPPFDYFCPLMTLPARFGTTLSTVPAAIPYLSAPPASPQIRERLAAHEGQLNVGIVWAGSPTHANDRFRSIDVAPFLALAEVPGVRLLSLQKGERAKQLAQAPRAELITDLSALLGDFADTAAAILSLDLVITVDSAVGHLAGALGKAVWVLLPFAGDWRWLEGTDRSPWYPSLRLFRQTRAGDWRDAFTRVSAELSAFTRTARNAPKPEEVSSNAGEIATLFATAVQNHRADQIDRAMALYRRVIELDPHHGDALNNLGVALRVQSRHDEAVPFFERAIAVNSTNPEYGFNLGNALRALRRLPEAIASYRRALSLDANSARILSHLGLALREAGRIDEAVDCHRRALDREPDSSRIHNNLGAALIDAGKIEAALAHFRIAVSIEPNFAGAHANRGVALFGLGRFEEAVASHQQALRLDPNHADARANLGQALISLGRFDEALRELQAVKSAAPDHLDAELGLARCHLLSARFVEGWAAYEARWRRKGNAKPNLPGREWDGSDPRGRTILLYAEQGLGDTIQFVRYAKMVSERGATVVVRCPHALTRLVATVPGVSKVLSGPELPLAFDAHVALLSLPRLFDTTPETVPASVPYMAAPAKDMLLPQRKPGERRIGIVWGGNPEHQNDRFRSCSLSWFLDLAGLPGVTLYSLQKGPPAEELRRLGVRQAIRDVTDRLSDFADTAALINELDLVICVDTAVAHLTGALGRPVWTLIPTAPDWRWFGQGETTPWYPTMRLFRQTQIGEWKPVFERVKAALIAYDSSHETSS